MPKRKKQKKPRFKPKLDKAYVEQRRRDLIYYIGRSDLSFAHISKTLGFSTWWLNQVKSGLIKRPNDHRIGVVIDFVKDYERLQTYYAALLGKRN